MTSSKIRTVYDAGQERRDEAALSEHRAIVNQNKLNLERAKLSLYPEIGTLTRKGKTVFYAHPNGQYVESPDIDVVSREIDGGNPRIVRSTS